MRYCCLLLLAATCIPSFAQTASQHGVYVSDMDRTADPCNDFFDYANGTWRKENPIPAYMDRWSRRWKQAQQREP